MLDFLILSRHVVQRMALRGVDEDDINYVLENATPYIAGGVIHYFLGYKDIPERDRKFDRFNRLGGTTVLVDKQDRIVITVYRNRKSIKKDRRKAKYDCKKRPSQLPLVD